LRPAANDIAEQSLLSVATPLVIADAPKMGLMRAGISPDADPEAAIAELVAEELHA
jgi:hypothetical protein